MKPSKKINKTKEMIKIQQDENNNIFDSQVIETLCNHGYFRVLKNKFNNKGQKAFECKNCGIIF